MARDLSFWRNTENLIKYTEYARGSTSVECSLQYSDINISNLDFSKYDLNNSAFCGVEFNLCDFSNVYLSGSNFGGSVLKDCIFRENIIKKASWDDMTFEQVRINLMNAFRTTFMFGKFLNTDFEKCHIDRCSFSGSELVNVYFRESVITDTDFTDCKLENVYFTGCKLKNVSFDEGVNKHNVFLDDEGS